MGKKINKSSRNVLGLPKRDYWPSLQESESESLILLELQKNLKKARTIHPNYKWAEIRKLKREERAKKIENFFKNLSDQEQKQHKEAKDLKKCLALGVNEVTRSIENKQLACCLVDGHAKPKMLITHILQLAKCRGIPVLILNDLKKSSRECLGFSTLAIGFMKEVANNENHPFHTLCISLLNSYTEVEDVDKIKETYEEKYNESPEVEAAKCSKQIEISDDIDNFMCTNSDYTSLYLYRTSANYRVFHPPDKEFSYDEEEEMTTKVSVDINSSDDDKECPTPNKKIKYFFEPNILRIQSNPNKLRKKKKNKK